MNIETKPKAQMPIGKALDAAVEGLSAFLDGVFIRIIPTCLMRSGILKVWIGR